MVRQILAVLTVAVASCGAGQSISSEPSGDEALPTDDEAESESLLRQRIPGEGPLARLGWLSGEWVSWDEERGTCTTEVWMTPSGTSMLGANRTVREGRTVASEVIRIESRDEEIFYVAAPSGQSETEFRLSRFGADSDGTGFAVFENPEHDFPVRVRYALTAGILTARINGRRANQSASWVFRRLSESACPPVESSEE